MTLWKLHASRALVIGGIGTAVLCQSIGVAAQETVEPPSAPVQPGTVAPGTTESGQPTQTPRTEEAIAEQQRRAAQERAVRDDRRYREDHLHHGETYVAGFGGVTFGSTTRNMAAVLHWAPPSTIPLWRTPPYTVSRSGISIPAA